MYVPSQKKCNIYGKIYKSLAVHAGGGVQLIFRNLAVIVTFIPDAESQYKLNSQKQADLTCIFFKCQIAGSFSN